MKLHVVATGSSGNCYILDGKDSALVLEAGVQPEKVFRMVRTSTRKIAGVLITHEHGDHAKFVHRWLELGFPVYMSAGTRDALRLEDAAGVVTLRTGSRFELNDAFEVTPLRAIHDAAEPVFYIIQTAEAGRILFATDTMRIPYHFVDGRFRHILIEVNFINDLLNAGIDSRRVLPPLAARIRGNHQSLLYAEMFLESHVSPELETVVLIHLSEENADPGVIAARIGRICPYSDVHVAVKGLVVPLGNALI